MAPNLDLFPLSGARLVPLDLIQPGQYQPRKRFTEDRLQELAASVRQHGVMQPILLRNLPGDRFEIVAGERRWRASKLAGKDAIPAVARDLTTMEVLTLQAIENIQREDLHPLEEADSYQMLVAPPDGSEGLTPSQVAETVSRTERHVRQRLALVGLIPQVRDAFWDGVIVLQTALAIARMPVDIQGKAWPRILATRATADKPVVHRDAEKILATAYMLRLSHATFPIKDATLLPEAGACDACPSRTGANPDLFHDVDDQDTCTNPECHAAKVQAFNERRKVEARERGIEVIDGKAASALLKFGPDSTALNADYVYMDEPLEELTGSKSSLKKLLGTLLAPSAVFEHPRDHTLREIVHTVKARQVLKDHGLLMHRPSKGEQAALVAPPSPKGKATTTSSSAAPAPVPPKDTQAEAEQRAARRLQELAWRKQAVGAAHFAMHDADQAPEPLLRAAVIDYAAGIADDAEVWELLASMWDWMGPSRPYAKGASLLTRLEAVTADMNTHQLALLMCDLALMGDLQVTDEQIEDEAELEELQVVQCCDDPDVDWGIDWRAIRAGFIKPAKRARKSPSPSYPPKSPPPAGDDKGAPTQGVSDVPSPTPKKKTSQLSGSAGQGAGGDRAFWIDQFVRVKRGVRKGAVGIVWTLQPNGDVCVCFDHEGARSDRERFSPNELEALPGQTRPATDGSDEIDTTGLEQAEAATTTEADWPFPTGGNP